MQGNRKFRDAITSGLRLCMLNEQMGWAIGTSQSSNLASVLRTTDGGKQWEQVTPPLLSHEVSYLYILNETTLWLPEWIRGGKIRWLHRTIDGGKSWQRFDWHEKDDHSAGKLTFCDQDHGWLLVYMRDVNPAIVLYRTSNGGETWQEVGPVPCMNAFELFFTDEQTGWLKEFTRIGQRLMVTRDGGQHWQSVFLPGPGVGDGRETLRQWYRLTFFSEHEGSIFAGFGENATKDMYLYMTHDGGRTWQRRGNAFPGGVEPLRLLDEQHIQAGMLSDEGENFIVLLTLVDEEWIKTILHPNRGSDLQDVIFVSAQVGIALLETEAQDLDVYKTSDGGKIWRQISTLPKAH